MEPFGPAELTRRFAPLGQARGVLLAVSGGPDSVALMLLVQAWAGQSGTALPIAVATVDHGLRPESRQEAVAVGDWAATLGLPHHILTWEGAKPRTAVQERARQARYKLLFQHAQEIGADHVLTAHHADDQAETILFRLLRGSGPAGLAGMPAAARRGDVVHLRPLLDCPKEELVALCDAREHPYFRDASNENPVFARARLRKLAPVLAAEGLDRDALLRLGRRAARADLALETAMQRLRAALPATRADGLFTAAIGVLADVPAEIFLRVIEAEIAALGTEKPLRLDRLETLAAAVQSALQQGLAWRGSLAGWAVLLDQSGILTIRRENPRRRGRTEPKATQNSPWREGILASGQGRVTSG